MTKIIFSALCAATLLLTSCDNKAPSKNAEVKVETVQEAVKKSIVLGNKADKDKAQKYTIGCGNCIFEIEGQEKIDSLWLKKDGKFRQVIGIKLSDSQQLALCKAAHAQQAFISGVEKDGQLEATYIEVLPDPHNH